VLEEDGYGSNGEFIGLDVKAMRTQSGTPVTDHLKNSQEIFLHLVEKVRSYDRDREQQLIAARDYESLELYVIRHLLGVA
jgi:xylose isomerase